MADFEPKIECPYNKSHQLLPDRFQTHLVKCRKQHPKEKKVQCPFNATHIVGECERQYHIDNCPDVKNVVRFCVDQSANQASTSFKSEPINNEAIVCSKENWDDSNVPTYDPGEYTAQMPILRNMQGSAPSERKQFRTQERMRVSELRHKVRMETRPASKVGAYTQLEDVREPSTVFLSTSSMESASSGIDDTSSHAPISYSRVAATPRCAERQVPLRRLEIEPTASSSRVSNGSPTSPVLRDLHNDSNFTNLSDLSSICDRFEDLSPTGMPKLSWRIKQARKSNISMAENQSDTSSVTIRGRGRGRRITPDGPKTS